MLPNEIIRDPMLCTHWEPIASALLWAADNGYSNGPAALSAFAQLMGTTAQHRCSAHGDYFYFAERPWDE